MAIEMGKNQKNIIGIFGKKQSGKTTSYKFIEKHVPLNFVVQKFSFAEKLKRLTADIFNVDYNKLVGTEEDKSSPTHLYWSDVDLMIKLSFFGANHAFQHGKITHRQLLQLVGTDLFRAIKKDVWVENTIRAMEKSQANLCVVDDVRFENELEAIRNAGGYLVKLYSIFDLGVDTHPSESLFDEMPDNYFDFAIRDYNKERTIKQLDTEWARIIKQILRESN